jgi:kynurenine formamidase
VWPTALTQLQYDYLVVQPHYGTTLGQDVETISRWMRMQPGAIVVIHNGWARNASEAEEFAAAPSDQMGHRPEYFRHLIDELKQRYPEREFRQTFTTHTLHQISQDIEAGNAPLEQLQALYRDAIHMTHGEGRYLMHNLMRLALDQPPGAEGFTIERDRPELKSYLDNLIRLRQ